MNLLPIVHRELRIASRKPGTYRTRWILAGSVLLVWFFLLATSRHSMPITERGRMLFTAVGILAFAFCLLAGVFLTADCLSREKREGTLGLLFLTDLKGYDVVLGKLAATSLPAFYGLLTVFPLLALPLLMGGVSVAQFWRVTLALLTTLLLSLSLGMLVSALSRDTRTSIGVTLLLLLGLLSLPPSLWALGRLFGLASSLGYLLFVSPGFLYGRAYDLYYRSGYGLNQFAASFITLSLLAFGSLLASGAWLRRFWRDKTENAGPVLRPARRAWRFVPPNFTARADWLIPGKAWCWVCGRDRLPACVATALLGSLFLIWLCFVPGCLSAGMVSRNACFSVLMFMGFAMHVILKVFVSIEASRRMSEDQSSGALELLLVTPITIEAIISGQIRALKNIFLLPAGILFLINVILLWLMLFPNPMRMPDEVAPVFVELYLGGMVVLILDMYVLQRVAMLLGLRKSRHHWAIFGTLARVVIPPWIAVFCFMFVGVNSGATSEREMAFWVGFYFLLACALDVSLARWADRSLITDLRQRADRQRAR